MTAFFAASNDEEIPCIPSKKERKNKKIKNKKVKIQFISFNQFLNLFNDWVTTVLKTYFEKLETK